MITDTPPRRWVSRQGAADYLGVSVTTLYRLVSAGRITRYPIIEGQAGTIRYDLNEIDQMVLACAAPASAASDD